MKDLKAVKDLIWKLKRLQFAIENAEKVKAGVYEDAVIDVLDAADVLLERLQK